MNAEQNKDMLRYLYDPTRYEAPLDTPFRAGAWKEDSDRLYSPQDAVLSWSYIRNAGFLPPEGNGITFVSPTANIASHEAALFEDEVAHRRPDERTRFFVGDFAPIPTQTIQEYLPVTIPHQSTFKYIRWDAESLPLKSGSLDVIWDRKGWLWHTADIGRKQGHDVSLLVNAFAQYHRLLKPNGVVVIDNIETKIEDILEPEDLPNIIKNTLQGKFNQITRKQTEGVSPSEVLPHARGQYEPSTVYLIDRLTKNAKRKFLDFIGQYYEVTDVGEDIHKTRILRKLPRNNPHK